MQQRRGTAEQWELINPVLASGEIGFETDNNRFKLGDGTTAWLSLPYFVDETNLSASLEDYIPLDSLGTANGVATLDAQGQVPLSQLGNAPDPDLSAYATIQYVDDEVAPKAPSLNPTFTIGTSVAPLVSLAGKTFTNTIFDGDLSTSWSPTYSVLWTGADNYYGFSNISYWTDPSRVSSIQNYLNQGVDVKYYSVDPTTTPTYGYSISIQNGAVVFTLVDISQTSITPVELFALDGISSNIQSQLDAKLESSDLAGYATQTYVNNAVQNVVGLAPETLNTLAEIADALGDDPNAITAIQTDLGNLETSVSALQTDKADTNSPTFTGLTDFQGIVDFSDAVVVGIDALPDQTGNAGKYLTTDGTNTSWADAASPVPHPFTMMG